MDWSQKRKILYAVGFSGIIIILAAYPTYQLVHRAPTCLDKKQNGTETGVDCGGSCALACLAEIRAPQVVWAKAFPLGGGYYDLGAYVENPNTKAGVKNARYTFRVYGFSGNILVEKKSTAQIAPGSGFILFISNVVITEDPNRVEVVFDQEDLVRWNKSSTVPSFVSVKNKNLKNTDTRPRFDAVLVNSDPINSVSDIALSAVVYNGSRNPVAVSQTYVDMIPKSGEQNVFFTWPSKFSGTSENFVTEIIFTPHVIFEE